MEPVMQRWERRERKKQAQRDQMKKSGMSVRLLEQIIGRRAAAAKAKAAREQERPPVGKKPRARRRH
jgi:hypothetical protein